MGNFLWKIEKLIKKLVTFSIFYKKVSLTRSKKKSPDEITQILIHQTKSVFKSLEINIQLWHHLIVICKSFDSHAINDTDTVIPEAASGSRLMGLGSASVCCLLNWSLLWSVSKFPSSLAWILNFCFHCNWSFWNLWSMIDSWTDKNKS